MAIQLYNGGISKIVTGLSATLVLLSGLTLSGVGVVEYIVPIFNEPSSFQDFASLDQNKTPISCDNLMKGYHDSNIGIDENINNYQFKQCAVEIKSNINQNCNIYAKEVYQRVSELDNSSIDMNRGNAQVCTDALTKIFGDYNEGYEINQKGGENFLYIKKYNNIILGHTIGEDTVEIHQSKLDDNLWYVQFTHEDKNSDGGYKQDYLYFTNKDKATTFYTAMKNINNPNSEIFSKILTDEVKTEMKKNHN